MLMVAIRPNATGSATLCFAGKGSFFDHFERAGAICDLAVLHTSGVLAVRIRFI